MYMSKSRDIQVKMPSPKVIWNAFWLVTVKVLNSYTGLKNPDLDENFVEFYKETCEEISRLLHTDNETLILGGEGILGLEAACASMTEPGDRVLVLDNGIYGKGFADFVSMYGGCPELYSRDYRETLDVQELENFLKEHHNYKYATVVHGDTPSGMLNDVSAICPLLKKYGIMTVVDSVSASFGEPMRISDWQIDIMCGGSQKVVSAPPGLTFVVISDDAKKAMADRKTPIASFYANLTTFAHYYEEKWFPYTMPISDIYGLRAAIDNIAADPDILTRHEKIAEASRKAITGAGLNLLLYLKSRKEPPPKQSLMVLKMTTTSCLQVLLMYLQAKSSASDIWETMLITTMFVKSLQLWTERSPNLVFHLKQAWKNSSATA